MPAIYSILFYWLSWNKLWSSAANMNKIFFLFLDYANALGNVCSFYATSCQQLHSMPYCIIARRKGMENSWDIGVLYSRNVFRLAELYFLVKLSFLIEILY